MLLGGRKEPPEDDVLHFRPVLAKDRLEVGLVAVPHGPQYPKQGVRGHLGIAIPFANLTKGTFYYKIYLNIRIYSSLDFLLEPGVVFSKGAIEI